MRFEISVILLLLASIGGPACAAKKIEVQGHRGARWVRPENTLPAFQYALDVGVDTLELDTVFTKDDHVVVTHDLDLNPDLCLDSKGKRIAEKIAVRSLTLAELRTYDCGTLVNPRFKEQTPIPQTPIPTLDEVFELAAKHPNGRRVLFNVETKIEPDRPDDSPSPEIFVDSLIAIFRKHRLMERVILQSFDYRTLRTARAKAPELTLSVLVGYPPRESLPDLAQAYGAKVVSPNYLWLTTKEIQAAHSAGLRVIPWTVNGQKDWEKIIALEVDGIITDNPKPLIEMLKARK